MGGRALTPTEPQPQSAKRPHGPQPCIPHAARDPHLRVRIARPRRVVRFVKHHAHHPPPIHHALTQVVFKRLRGAKEEAHDPRALAAARRVPGPTGTASGTHAAAMLLIAAAAGPIRTGACPQSAAVGRCHFTREKNCIAVRIDTDSSARDALLLDERARRCHEDHDARREPPQEVAHDHCRHESLAKTGRERDQRVGRQGLLDEHVLIRPERVPSRLVKLPRYRFGIVKLRQRAVGARRPGRRAWPSARCRRSWRFGRGRKRRTARRGGRTGQVCWRIAPAQQRRQPVPALRRHQRAERCRSVGHRWRFGRFECWRAWRGPRTTLPPCIVV